MAETTGVQVNKEDYYSEEGSPEALISLFSMGGSASGLRPVNLSSDVTYFGAYEGGSYAQTLSSGDGVPCGWLLSFRQSLRFTRFHPRGVCIRPIEILDV